MTQKWQGVTKRPTERRIKKTRSRKGTSKGSGKNKRDKVKQK